MPSHRALRRAAVVAAVAVCLVPVATSAAPPSDGRRPDPVSERSAFPSRSNPLTSSQYTGVDGKTHKRSPILVRGKNPRVYYGEEFDGACGYGQQFNRGMNRLARLARVIERSGRRVVFTVAPNKSAVVKQDILKSQLPHGKCDLLGIAQQDKLLDTFDNNDYVAVRKLLADRAAHGQQHLFWPIDTHWTRVGAQTWVDALAAHLDPELAARQTSRKGKETIETDVSFLGVIPETRETGPATYSTTPVKVVAHPAYDSGRVVSLEHTWTSRPASRAWPGRTLLIGDSFTYRALDNLMPLFAHGRFLWYGQEGVPSISDGIVKADTVVIAIVQRWVPISPLTTTAFRREVTEALAGAGAGRSHQ
jgi:hypothetical protein